MAIYVGRDGRIILAPPQYVGRLGRVQLRRPSGRDVLSPTVSSFSPIDGAIAVAINANLVINFNENVFKGTGDIVVKRTSDDSTFETIDVTSDLVTISDNQVTINPSGTFAGETGYYVEIDNSAFRDLVGNYYAGISVKTTWNFTSADVAPPTVNSFVPADDATEVAIDANLVINFNENVQKGTGDIVIKKTTGDSVVETIDVTSGLVTVSAAQITINPTANFDGETGYYVEIASGAIKDMSNNGYAGISDKTTWNFVTADVGAPTVSSFVPADEATEVAIDANLVINFNENIQKGTGNIVIKLQSDDSTLETIDVTSGLVVVSAAQATINPSGDLTAGTGYYVQIDSGAFEDLSSNDYAGISDKTTWNFRTIFSDSISFIEAGLTGSGKWKGGVAGADGCIYGIPLDSATVLKLDPSDDSTSTFGALGAGGAKWGHGVLAGNGCIYGIPFNSANVLKIDPSGPTVSTFASGIGGDYRYIGGALAANGYIYCIPFNATTILKINPSNDTVSTFGTLSGSTGKWDGGVLADNGCIYGVPFDSVTVLKIDPTTDTASTFGNISGNAKFAGGILAANGCIYCIPYAASDPAIAKINPSNDTVSTFGYLQGTTKWEGGVFVEFNGCIYGIPFDSTTILKIDTADDSVSLFGTLNGENKWDGGVFVASNGCVYGIPCNSEWVLKVS